MINATCFFIYNAFSNAAFQQQAINKIT